MEKYGTIPPRFTKAWWAHYWFYYKYHLIAVLCAIIFVVSYARSCITAIDYDLKVQMYSQYMLVEEQTSAIEDKLREISGDATGNGKVEVMLLSQADLPESAENAEFNYATSMKFMADLEAADHNIYIVNKNYADKLTQQECMASRDLWAGDVAEDLCYGESFVSLSGNKFFADLGVDTDDLYIGVLSLYDRYKDKEENVKRYENALVVAKELIKE